MARPTKYKVGLEGRQEKKKQKEQDQVANVEKAIEQEKERMSKLDEKQIAQMVADFTRKDPFLLKGLDPRFRYRFINRSADRLDRQTMRGWEIVTGPEAEKIAKLNKIKTRQGQILVGDSTLAKVPFEVYIAIRKNLDTLNKRVLGRNSAALKRDMGKKYSRNVEEDLKVRDRGNLEEKVI